MQTFYWIISNDAKVCNFCLDHYLKDFKSKHYGNALRRIRHTIGRHEQTCRCWPSLAETEPTSSPYPVVDTYLKRLYYPVLSNEEWEKLLDDLT